MCGYEFANPEKFKEADTTTQKLIYNKQGGAIVPINRKRNSDHVMCPECHDICNNAIDDFMEEYGELVKIYQKRINLDIKLAKADTKTKKAKILLDG